jgi:hypothetical protein
VAISDYAGEPIHTRNFLIAQGYLIKSIVIDQDNQSSIVLTKRGYSTSDKTRHINIRYFWISDRIDDKEVIIEYVPTEEMLSDILTKPLQGERFIELRNRLLGISSDPIKGVVGSSYLIYG